MNIKKNNLLKPVIYLTLSASLAACGGSSDDVIGEVIEDTLNGVTINADNYDSVFQKGYIGSLDAIGAVLYGGASIDRTTLSTIDRPENAENSITYQCDNVDGSFTATQITDDSEGLNFDNCHIIDAFSNTTRYDGVTTIITDIHSGTAADIGDYDTNWSVTQSITMTNFTQTSPIDSGDSHTANGNMTLKSSNDTEESLNQDVMESTNLIIDLVEADTAATTSYNFSDVYYDVQEDSSDDSTKLDVDLTADITDIGDLQITTNPALVIDNAELIQSGTVTLDTGSSSLKAVALGDDSVDISLDYDNNGDYDIDISTTYSNFSD